MTNLTPDEQLAALEGWASNPAVPLDERLQAARQVIAGLRAKVAELEALRARVAALAVDPYEQVPPDETMWLVTYTGGYQPDRPPREKVWHRLDFTDRETHPDGTWWQLGDHNHHYQWLEVIGHDDPPEDRPSVTMEQVIPAEVLERELYRPTPP